MATSQTPHGRTDAKLSRYFVALLPPATIQVEATRWQQYFHEHYNSKAALRSPPHITLQPPFKWPPEKQAQLSSTLASFAVKWAAIPIHLNGFGAFPPRVIFMDVEKTPALMHLQSALMAHLADALGIIDARSQHRPFAPHLTVAFRDLKPAAFRKAWPDFEQRPFQAAFRVPELTLLMHDGRCWQVATQYPFQDV